ncbi:MAG: aldo/keto reductase [Sediminimonas qiaohouensis]|uniref:Aldo/keto reductase n=1 Tax=Sediminimonas qiaohouensis TaxID=552061 RepID=A0A7C9L9W6_9RHOB|nr:aldo/keto reductase [Sediminimonas qiaohouensis]MTJ03558.1 aldo/keto reductase [Sediminimonas qiaohouensis]
MTQLLTSPDGTPASRLAFGTMQFGGRADADQAAEMVRDCLAAGLTHFDTAHVYNDGASEQITGRLLRPHRERVIIATKAGFKGGAGRDNILRQFDESRRRLDMDMVDILYLHRFDPDTELAETMETFAALRDRGQIRHVGLSNFAAWQVMKAQWVAAQFDLRISILQPMYNLVKRQAEVEILPMCTDQSIAVAPYSPLGGGLLTGKYARGETGRLSEDQGYADRYAPEWMHRAAQELIAIAAEHGTDPATLAVAWVAAHPTGPTPIISARTSAQLAPSLAALSHDMSADLRARLSALTPEPPPATDRLEEA